jgi:hypothetical protein
MKYTFVKLPRAGLGNKLLVWAMGYIHAKDSGSFFCYSSWFYFNIGPWIRREKSKRLYFFSFKFRTFRNVILSFFFYNFLKYLPPKFKKNFICFHKIPDFDSFYTLYFNRRFEIRDAIISILSFRTNQVLRKLVPPDIGVHVRRGDFKYGSPFTDISFFVEKILEIRDAYGADLSVIVFTDGTFDEIKKILTLKNVSISSNGEDILDLFQLSTSKFCILSKGSSFSFWASFFSTGKVYYSF